MCYSSRNSRGVNMSINRKAQKNVPIEKVIHDAMRIVNQDLDEEWIEHISYEKDVARGRTRKKRLMQRLIDGRAINPCGKECHEWGLCIVSTHDHRSMKNSKELIDDKEFLLKAMKVTPSPIECTHFFYDYVNPYLKKDKKFRMKLLKTMFLNDHILGQADIEWFVEKYHYEVEYDTLRIDESFKQYLIQTFEPKLEIPESLNHWDNIDEKNEKRRYKKSHIRMHDIAQDRFNDMMRCFAVDDQEEVDDYADFYRQFALDFKI